MAGMLARTIGDRVRIGLLAFCLFVLCAVDCFGIYGALKWLLPRHIIPWFLPAWLYLPYPVYRALRRRLSISRDLPPNPAG